MIQENDVTAILNDSEDNSNSKLKFQDNNITNIIEPLKGDLYGEANCFSKLFFIWPLKILMVFLI
jgi:hypothetical protein